VASSIVAIGDELLAGFTLDTNSHWLAERLRLLGYPLKRITTIRDREGDIVETLRRDLADPELDAVFCCGGLGPAPLPPRAGPRGGFPCGGCQGGGGLAGCPRPR